MGQNPFASLSFRSIFAATTSFLSAFTFSSRICMLVSAGLSCANEGAAVSAITQKIVTLITIFTVVLPIMVKTHPFVRENLSDHNCQKLQSLGLLLDSPYNISEWLLVQYPYC